MAKAIKIGNHFVGCQFEPFVVAELSGNHNNSLDRAFEIIEAAAAAGVHGLKLQTYTADSMTLDIANGPFRINDEKSLWNGRTLFDLYKEAATPYEWHAPIFEKCKKLGIECFSTPFDASAVDFLETLNVPCYKIASFENTDLPLIKKVAQTGKPLIVSTGMASITEIAECVEVAKSAGCKDLILLKCTSSYPALPIDSNIRTIPHLAETFQVEVGISDHTLGLGVSVAAISLGATFIEKHFTLRRSDGGVDSAFSMEPEEMRNLVVESKRAWQALGAVSYSLTKSEEKNVNFRRSVMIIKDVKKGEVLNTSNIACLRPNIGLAPKNFEFLLGRTAAKDMKKGSPVFWEDIG